jgi:NTE family protein
VQVTEGSCRIGFALSGGAVRGAAHIGVLRVFEEAGLGPALIAGTSVGAIIGAACAAGRSLRDVERLFAGLDWFSLVRPTLKLRRSLMDTRRLGRFLRAELGLTTFAELRIPFAAVACDLDTGDAVPLTRGDLVQAIRASSALPGLFPPERVDGRLLVDGGIVENLPVDVVRSMGAGFVVAVDLLPMGDRTRRVGNLFEIWHRSVYLMVRGNHPARAADCHVITPRIAEFSFTDFGEVAELVRRGEEAARAALPAIRREIAASRARPGRR